MKLNFIKTTAKEGEATVLAESTAIAIEINGKV